MTTFIRELFNNFFSSMHAWRINLFSLAKSALVFGLLPFLYAALFVPMFFALELMIVSVAFVFGNGLLFNFINTFWSFHINLCVSLILSLKLTLYFHYLYTNVKNFQFQSVRVLK